MARLIRPVAIALTLAAVVMPGVLFLSRPSFWYTPDSRVYKQLAENLLTGRYGRWSGITFVPEAIRMPGYPVLLFTQNAFGRPGDGTVIGIQFFLYLAALVLAWRILARRHVDVLTCLIIAAVYPFGAAYACKIGPEAFTLFLVTALACMVSRPRPLGFPALAMCGFMSGVGTLLRPDLLLLPLVVVAADWIREKPDRRAWRETALRVLTPLLVTACVLAPYGWRNWSVFGTPIPLPPAGGLANSLFTASWEGAVSAKTFVAFGEGVVTEEARQSGLVDQITRINTDIGAPPGTPPFTAEGYGTLELQLRATKRIGQAAVDRIRSHPWDYVRHVAASWWRLWNTEVYPEWVPVWLRGAASLTSTTIWAAAGIGVILVLTGQYGNNLWGPTLLLLYFPLMHCWLHTEARYTASARVLLMLHAVLGTAWCLRRFRPVTGLLGTQASTGDS